MKKRSLLAIGNDEMEERIRKFDLEVIDSDRDLDIIADILDYEPVDVVIANTLLSERKLLALAEKAQKKSVKIIALIESFQKNPEVIAALAAQGVYAFVPFNSLQLVKEYLATYPESFDFSQLPAVGVTPKGVNGGEGPRAPFRKKTTVALIGCMERIGTTTQALAMATYLVRQGYTACYVEMNSNEYIKELISTYSGADIDEELGKATYNGVDIYFAAQNLSYITRQPYQFFIYDYGDLLQAEKLEMSWQEKDIYVLCAGTKPNELFHMQFALEKLIGYDTKYIFSFSPEEEHLEIQAAMGPAKYNSFFAEYAPDPFMAPDAFYGELLEVQGIAGYKTKKGRLFKRTCD